MKTQLNKMHSPAVIHTPFIITNGVITVNIKLIFGPANRMITAAKNKVIPYVTVMYRCDWAWI